MQVSQGSRYTINSTVLLINISMYTKIIPALYGVPQGARPLPKKVMHISLIVTEILLTLLKKLINF